MKDDLIFIKSGSNWRGKEDETIIDVYSAINGDYFYSFKIPVKMAMT